MVLFIRVNIADLIRHANLEEMPGLLLPLLYIGLANDIVSKALKAIIVLSFTVLAYSCNNYGIKLKLHALVNFDFRTFLHIKLSESVNEATDSLHSSKEEADIGDIGQEMQHQQYPKITFIILAVIYIIAEFFGTIYLALAPNYNICKPGLVNNARSNYSLSSIVPASDGVIVNNITGQATTVTLYEYCLGVNNCGYSQGPAVSSIYSNLIKPNVTDNSGVWQLAPLSITNNGTLQAYNSSTNFVVSDTPVMWLVTNSLLDPLTGTVIFANITSAGAYVAIDAIARSYAEFEYNGGINYNMTELVTPSGFDQSYLVNTYGNNAKYSVTNSSVMNYIFEMTLTIAERSAINDSQALWTTNTSRLMSGDFSSVYSCAMMLKYNDYGALFISIGSNGDGTAILQTMSLNTFVYVLPTHLVTELQPCLHGNTWSSGFDNIVDILQENCFPNNVLLQTSEATLGINHIMAGWNLTQYGLNNSKVNTFIDDAYTKMLNTSTTGTYLVNFSCSVYLDVTTHVTAVLVAIIIMCLYYIWCKKSFKLQAYSTSLPGLLVNTTDNLGSCSSFKNSSQILLAESTMEGRNFLVVNTKMVTVSTIPNDANYLTNMAQHQ